MVYNGQTSGPCYTTTLLPDDTLVNLTKVAQANLRVKLVRPQCYKRVGIDNHLIVETAEQAGRTNEIYTAYWNRVNPDDDGPIMTENDQRRWNINQKSLHIITSLGDLPKEVLSYKKDYFARWYDILPQHVRCTFG
jgi:hypothetical protein